MGGQDTIYKLVADDILGALDKGVIPWVQPWSTEGGKLLSQRNAFTNRLYTGSNVFALYIAGHSDPRWATFNSIVKAGGRVRKGAKSRAVIMWKFVESEDRDNPGKFRTVPILRYYRVINIEDTEGLDLPSNKQPARAAGFDPIVEAETIANNYHGPTVSHDGGARAYYRSDSDSIHLPPKYTFNDAGGYYGTLFHELSHSTGHKSRLDRLQGNGPFGSCGYGREELIAEFSAAYLSATAGIDGRTIDNPAAYIASWKRTIRADMRCVVVAAGRAQKASDYVLGLNQ